MPPNFRRGKTRQNCVERQHATEREEREDARRARNAARFRHKRRFERLEAEHIHLNFLKINSYLKSLP